MKRVLHLSLILMIVVGFGLTGCGGGGGHSDNPRSGRYHWIDISPYNKGFLDMRGNYNAKHKFDMEGEKFVPYDDTTHKCWGEMDDSSQGEWSLYFEGIGSIYGHTENRKEDESQDIARNGNWVLEYDYGFDSRLGSDVIKYVIKLSLEGKTEQAKVGSVDPVKAATTSLYVRRQRAAPRLSKLNLKEVGMADEMLRLLVGGKSVERHLSYREGKVEVQSGGTYPAWKILDEEARSLLERELAIVLTCWTDGKQPILSMHSGTVELHSSERNNTADCFIQYVEGAYLISTNGEYKRWALDYLVNDVSRVSLKWKPGS